MGDYELKLIDDAGNVIYSQVKYNIDKYAFEVHGEKLREFFMASYCEISKG